MRTLYTIALILVVIGAINWGLVGLFNLNFVAAIFGEMTVLTRLIYILVGIAGIVVAIRPTAQAARATPRRERTV